MKSNSLKKQKGTTLAILLVFIGAISTYLFWEMQEAETRKHNKRILNLHTQSDKYIVALKLYKKAYCNAGGVLAQSDLFPNFVGAEWEDMFGSSSVFSIESGSGITQYIVSTTFPTLEVANRISARRVKNILVEQASGSKVVKFTRTEELKATQYRNSYNRTNILTKDPSSC